MNLSDGYIYIDYRHAENAADDMVEQSQAIMSIIENLEMELTELKNTWIGEDSDVYRQVQANWNQAVQNIKNLLASNSHLLTDISDNYRYTEKALSDRWSSITIGSR
ncbi:WXG100 family type VII secretion target [Streptomyces sp. TRM 70361]|uniref:WXG100 family type VII secretion target n=1 Tax=Streptomyces sp. TRM 70361 TaxID=3116553 RepID=UPI002E7B0D01|nr:WXG100 family type VII secretion target [Streptomyces sp. TRM 70361]MEE1940111.1 WXG100 family type VII secretion target [Streptomyces sp. TRM 70361]